MNNAKIISPGNLSLGCLATALVALPFSVKVCHAALLLYLIGWLAEGQWKEKFAAIKTSTVLKLMIVFVVLQLAGVLYSQNESQAWFSIEKKFFLFTVPVAVATSSHRFDEKKFRLLLYMFVLGGVAAAMICLLHAGWQTWLFIKGGSAFQDISYLDSANFGSLNSSHPNPWFFFSYVGLADGVRIHPTYLSLYLAFCVLFLTHELFVFNRMSRKNKVLIFCTLIFLTGIIILLSSRIIILSMTAIYIAISCFALFIRKQAVTFLCISVLMIAVIFLLWINPVSRYRSLQEFGNSSLSIEPNSTHNTSAEIRASLWWIGWRTFQDTNVLIGTGNGDVNDAMQETSETYSVTNIMDTFDPHNQYLYLLIGNGIPGLLVFLALLALPSVRALHKKNYLAVGFLMLFAALCVTESALELQKGIAFFAILFPLLIFHRSELKLQPATLNYSRAEN